VLRIHPGVTGFRGIDVLIKLERKLNKKTVDFAIMDENI
jgi:hypothetical protein